MSNLKSKKLASKAKEEEELQEEELKEEEGEFLEDDEESQEDDEESQEDDEESQEDDEESQEDDEESQEDDEESQEDDEEFPEDDEEFPEDDEEFQGGKEKLDDSADTSARYEIIVEDVSKLDIDGLNEFYQKLTVIDGIRYPKKEDVSGKGKFPKLPILLFDCLTKSQCDTLLAYLPTWFGAKVKIKGRKSTTEYPDKIKAKVGTFFNSDKIEFVKVTGFEKNGIFEDYWVATKPLTKRNIALAKKRLGKDFSTYDLRLKKEFVTREEDSSEDWFRKNKDIRDCRECLENSCSRKRPAGYHVGFLKVNKFEYALRGGQCGSPYKHPGTDNAVEFMKDNTINSLGMRHLAGRILCEWDDGFYYEPFAYSTKELRCKQDGSYGRIWFGIRIHSNIMKEARDYVWEQKEQQEKQRKLQEKKQRELQELQEEQEQQEQAVNAAVARRQKLLQKKKGK